MAAAAAEEAAAPTWQWPELELQGPPPELLLWLARQYGRRSDCSSADCRDEKLRHGNFLKGVKWSPDGACFLTCSEDTSLRVFDLLTSGRNDGLGRRDRVRLLLVPPHVRLREHPVHLWDAVSGEADLPVADIERAAAGHCCLQLRCTYRAYDHLDEVTAAHSLAFTPAGDKLYCGYNKIIRVFDTSIPGRDFQQHSTLTKARDGQNGILSCLAFSPADACTFAAGSYNRTTGIYDSRTCEALLILHGQVGGVTQASSDSCRKLQTIARNFQQTAITYTQVDVRSFLSFDEELLHLQDPYILCWDVRQSSTVIYKMHRAAEGTNQRIAFDIEPCGRHLATGGQHGEVRIFDLFTGEQVSSFHAAPDTVNGCSFHPWLPLAATSSGQRQYNLTLPQESDSEEDKDGSPSAALEGRGGNCVAVWRFQCKQPDDTLPESILEGEALTSSHVVESNLSSTKEHKEPEEAAAEALQCSTVHIEPEVATPDTMTSC
eukprot:SM000098S25126  [mRNA]  locus=s98:339039:343820:- [translate_table: standard]